MSLIGVFKEQYFLFITLRPILKVKPPLDLIFSWTEMSNENWHIKIYPDRYQSNYKQIVMFYVVARITHTLHYCQFSDILTVII